MKTAMRTNQQGQKGSQDLNTHEVNGERVGPIRAGQVIIGGWGSETMTHKEQDLKIKQEVEHIRLKKSKILTEIILIGFCPQSKTTELIKNLIVFYIVALQVYL